MKAVGWNRPGHVLLPLAILVATILIAAVLYVLFTSILR